MAAGEVASSPAELSRGLRDIPRGVWALGFVSLFMDMSSELIHSLMPIFMVSVLGASLLSVGLIEGATEAIVAVAKVFSGWLSDASGKRKPLTVIGYGLGALTKPFFPLATSLEWLLAARLVDRFGKGLRGAPRDAMVGDLAPPDLRGASYGLRQSLDNIGAFIGPLMAILLMLWLEGDIRQVYWWASVPALLCVLTLVFGVSEPARPPLASGAAPAPIRLADLASMGERYWWLLAIGTVMTLARFSEAFLLLRAQSFGLADAMLPLVFVAMNLVYAPSAYPVGRLSDRIGRTGLLFAGFAVLILADLVLAFGGSLAWTFLGVLLWGLHMGLTQGLISTMVADSSPERLRATAFGVLSLVSSVALLLASGLAGLFWDLYGPAATFLGGAVFASLALIGLAFAERRRRDRW
ncbi:MAG: MFS transporter [Proteobacteria bacterium]|nr:MFS transporter [Pseudomonadota bacterium]MBI3499925.1 MFS transporter [Pseudomonadota bacterium]